MTSTARRPAPAPPATVSGIAPPKLRYRSNPLRPMEKPINARHPHAKSATHGTGFKSKPTKSAALNPSAAQAQSVTAPNAPSPPVAPAAGSSPFPGAVGVPNAADPTTLPRGKVKDVYRRTEDGVHRATLTVTLTSGEERTVTDSGVEAIKVHPDLQTGDSCSLLPTGLSTFTWTKDADATVASAKPKLRRRVFLVDDLLGERGVRRLLDAFPSLVWKGYGHEAADVHRLMFLYRLWAKDMYPHAHFLLLMKRIEVMGASSRVQRYMDAYRYDDKDAQAERDADEPGSKRQRADAESEGRALDEAAAELMEDVYGEAEQDHEADLLREAKVGEGGEFDDALRDMGILPPLPAAAAEAPHRAREGEEQRAVGMEEELRQRMEDNKRKAMERLAARNRQRERIDELATSDTSAPPRSAVRSNDAPEEIPQPAADSEETEVAAEQPAPSSPSPASPSHHGAPTEQDAVEAAHADQAAEGADQGVEEDGHEQQPALAQANEERDDFFVPETLELSIVEPEDELTTTSSSSDAPAVESEVEVVPSSLSTDEADADSSL